jgi:aminomethyltransferase
MSTLWVQGEGAQALLSATLAADPARVKQGRAQYTVACRPDGTIIDDLIFYRFGADRFHVVPNAGMNQTFVDWFRQHAKGDVEVLDFSRQLCILALQGPKAPDVLASAYPDLAGVKRFGAKEWETTAGHAFVSGTGYTGEAGVELVVPNAAAASCWRHLLSCGRETGLVPAGLGARDTLRLEKGFCLAPHEFKGGRSPLEAGLGWVVHWDHDFVGRKALEAQKDLGEHDRLVGLKVHGRGIPREDCPVVRGGARVGVVTSGTMSPSLKTGIALAYVAPEAAEAGTELAVEVRGRPVDAVVAKLPFV